MIELDFDQVLEELTNLTKKPDADNLPEVLDRYLEIVSKNGDIIFPWSKVKPFMRRKLEIVMDSFHRENPLTESQMMVPNCKPFDYQNLKSEIMKSFDWFYAAPFTIQRLCELLIEPGKHYRRTDKLMRGIEKNVLVVSTVQPRHNKYATPETMEKQSNFKDYYPHFNSSPLHNNHSSSTPSASSSSSPTSGNMLNGSLDSPNQNAQAHNNSYDGYLNSGGHPLANSFYDQAPPPPQLNNHHHHLMDSMSDSGPQHSPLHPHHAPHPHSNHSQHLITQHSSSLAPLQQLDSFTNVFATTTTNSHHHLTHHSASYSIETSSHLTNGSSVGGWAHDASLKGAVPTNPYDSLLHPAHGSNHLNDDNENIIVDDEEEDKEKEDERKVPFGSGAEEKERFVYTTDSSNSTNSSDASPYTSDNSNDKDEALGLKSDDVETPQEPNSSSDGTTERPLERPIQELTPKKRPSPTPPPESSLIEGQHERECTSEDSESPLTPKKLRVQTEESSAGPSGEQQGSVQQKLVELGKDSSERGEEEDVSSESVIGSSGSASEESSSSSEQLSLPSDESTPMDMNGEDTVNAPQQESLPVDSGSGSSKSEDIPMSCPVTEESESPDDDQVMDEPMDQE